MAISTPPNAPGPVNGALYTITCNIQVMVPSNLYNGMTIAWSSNHGILSSDGNPKLGEPQVTGNIASQTLTFDPVDGSNTGEYTCTVTLGAPAVNPLSRNINVVLTSKCVHTTCTVYCRITIVCMSVYKAIALNFNRS